MSADDETPGSDAFEAEESQYVPAFFARHVDEADEYCELLHDHDIPARAGLEDEVIEEMDAEHVAAAQRGMTHGVPVLVPESLLDEASEIIADRQDLSEFDELDEEDEEDEDEEDDTFDLSEIDEPDEDFLDDEDEEEGLFGGDEDDDLDELEDEDEDDGF